MSCAVTSSVCATRRVAAVRGQRAAAKRRDRRVGLRQPPRCCVSSSTYASRSGCRRAERARRPEFRDQRAPRGRHVVHRRRRQHPRGPQGGAGRSGRGRGAGPRGRRPRRPDRHAVARTVGAARGGYPRAPRRGNRDRRGRARRNGAGRGGSLGGHAFPGLRGVRRARELQAGCRRRRRGRHLVTRACTGKPSRALRNAFTESWEGRDDEVGEGVRRRTRRYGALARAQWTATWWMGFFRWARWQR